MVAEDRKEAGRRTEDVREEAVYHATKQQTHPNADHDGRWLKKRNQTIYGYKKHVATDEAGMILAVHTTPANAHDSKGLVPLIKKVRTEHRPVDPYSHPNTCPPGTPFFRGKGA